MTTTYRMALLRRGRLTHRLAQFSSALLLGTSAYALMAAPAFAQAPAPASPNVLSPIVVKTPKDEEPSLQPRPQQVPQPAQGGAPAAAPTPTPSTATQFDALSTSSSKSAETIYDAPATVSVKSTAEMERQNINTTRDLVRDEPGVTVSNQPTRAGAGNYVIRGIGENRVRVEVDGIKVQDFPSPNTFAPTGYVRDFVDLESVKRVEIIRGPASALYGSDAIGGVVAYVTKDPADYLALVGKDRYGSVKGGFDTADRSVYTTLTGANRVGAFDSMILVTRRFGHEIKPNGTLAPNTQDYTGTNVLSKIVWNAPNLAKLTVTGEYTTRSLYTELRTEVTGAVLASSGNDETTRRRVSIDWQSPVSWWFADSLKLKVYATDLDRNEGSQQLRTGNLKRLSDFGFTQSIIGGEAQVTAVRRAFGASHELISGLTYDVSETSRPRYRVQSNLDGSGATTVVGGDTFPNKTFPDNTTVKAAAYVHDTAQWGAFRLVPALRVDYFSMTPKPDQMFANYNYGGYAVENVSTIALSPKLGATFDFSDTLRGFAQYARGFRAPPYDSANYAFGNPSAYGPAGGYEILGNPSLKAETSDGFELGLRGKTPAGSSFQVSAFYNMYKNFIDIVYLNTTNPTPTTILDRYQFQNLSNVTIMGYEAKGEYRVLPEWALFGSLAYAYGVNNDTNAAISSVEPWTGITGVRYRSMTSGWGGELRAKYVLSKDRTAAANEAHPAGHTIVDALVSYEIAPTLTVNGGLFNVFDTRYFNPIDVVGVTNSSGLDRYRAAGRTVAGNLTIRW